MNAKAPNISRSGERLIRLAYDLEMLASRLRLAGEESAANGVHDLAHRAGIIGRDLDRYADRDD